MKTISILLVFLLTVMSACFPGCKNSRNDLDASRELKYEQSGEIFPNPERGFTHLFGVGSEGKGLDTLRLASLKNENVSLIQRIYYFEKFKHSPLSEAELSLMRSDLQKVRNAGLKCVLSFAYTGQDYVYNTENGEDAPYETIEQHLDQLGPVFEDNQDVIAFVQAGFIGPWGEWHSSTNGLETTYYKTKVLEKMLSVIPKDIMVQVRTPRYKQEIFGTAEPLSGDLAFGGSNLARVGHYNDCFMASEDDYGTYVNIQAEKEYISQEALYVPTGGETCPPVPDDYPTGCTNARTTMRQLRWTYLNLDWYEPTVDGWRASGCFDEFQRNLGYRLALKSATIPQIAEKDQEIKVIINLTNAGYAPLYNFKNTSLILKDAITGEFHEVGLSVDLRDCKPIVQFSVEETLKLTGIPEGNFNLYLKIADRSENLKGRSAYSVRLANLNTWTEENGGMNDLKCQLRIGKN